MCVDDGELGVVAVVGEGEGGGDGGRGGDGEGGGEVEVFYCCLRGVSGGEVGEGWGWGLRRGTLRGGEWRGRTLRRYWWVEDGMVVRVGRW